MVKKGLFSVIILLCLVLASLSFVSAVAVINSVTLDDTDNFYSSYTGNNVIHITINISGLDLAAPGHSLNATFPSLTGIDCGNGLSAMVFSNETYAGEIYNGSCDVGAEAATSNFAASPVLILAIAAASPVLDTNKTVVLYNMTTPQMPPSCQRFGPLTTNFSRVSNFNTVEFVVHIQNNFTCMVGNLPHPASLSSEYQDVMVMNLTSVNLTTPEQAQMLAQLPNVLSLNITQPKIFPSMFKIAVNASAFTALNTNASISLKNLPFAAMPNVSSTNVSELNGITWVSNGFDSSFQLYTGNLTINVLGFTEYNASDIVAPTVRIVTPLNNSNTTNPNANNFISVLVNGTGTEPSYIQIVLANTTGAVQTYVYNDSSGLNTSNCFSVSANRETFNCTINRSLADGVYTITATAVDYGGSSGNTAANATKFTVDATIPTLTIVSPLNNTVFYANTTIPVQFSAADTGVGLNTRWYNNGTADIIYTQVTNITRTDTGRFNITFYANDSLGNAATPIIYFYNVSLAAANSTVAENSSMTIGTGTNSLIIAANSPLQNVTIPSTSTQQVYLDTAAILSGGSVTVSNNFTLTRDSGSANYTAYIPAGTTVTGASSWDGKIYLPIVNSTTFTAPGNGTNPVVIDMGSTGELNFSSAVKIIIGGMAGKRAAWARGSATLTAISTVCNNNATAPSNIDAATTRECYIDAANGVDLIIWTYHFTEFAAYTPAAATTTSDSSSSSSGSAGAGGEWTASYTVTDAARLAEGYTRTLGAKERIKFKINEIEHYVGILSIANGSATIRVASTPQEASLVAGDVKKFEVTGDNIYDIKVTLNKITGNRADLTIQTISEIMPAATTTGTNQTTTTTGTGVGTAVKQLAEAVKKSPAGRIIFWIILIVIVAVIVWFTVRFARKKQ